MKEEFDGGDAAGGACCEEGRFPMDVDGVYGFSACEEEADEFGRSGTGCPVEECVFLSGIRCRMPLRSLSEEVADGFHIAGGAGGGHDVA